MLMFVVWKCLVRFIVMNCYGNTSNHFLSLEIDCVSLSNFSKKL